MFANDVSLPPFQEAGRPDDKNNFQPRLGFAYRLTDRTVVRGGSGLYYGDALGADQSFAIGNAQIAVIQYNNDGRADFAANPTNGQPLPTYRRHAQFAPLRRFNAGATATTRGTAPCLMRAVQEFVGTAAVRPPAAHLADLDRLPASVRRHDGVRGRLRVQPGPRREGRRRQHQPDVQSGDRRQLSVRRSEPSRPYPDWGVVSMNTHLGRSAYHGLQTGFTKRFSNRWQASATYTLSGLWNADTKPFSGLDAGAVRHRSRSGRRMGSVGRRSAPPGGVQRHLAGGPRLPGERAPLPRRRHPAGAPTTAATCATPAPTGGGGRLRPDGTIVPRNSSDRAGAESDRPAAPAADPAARPRVDRCASPRCSTSSTGRTGHRHEENDVAVPAEYHCADRTAQFGFRLTF